ncbi:GGDEF domain-containing protein [Methylobacterium planeticum]|uniref:GGDEF domain-containing protein n=1 Tax=Methylobacterium planeticum TaxID=2615211 RepID=A0A6N6MMD8_9HYPH|nr:GGDEF domain-containing protein [Methylobacterium planeticum]KAB1072464.1 GGDEF domain-containing protein [Methylobacterium planeticum]
MRNDPGSVEAGRSLRQHKRLYEQAARLVRMGAWECDLATERLTWTAGVYDLFGLPAGARLTRSAIVDRYAEASRRELELVRAEAIRFGRGFVLDSEIRTWRGETRWIRITADLAFAEGRPVRLFGAKQDITGEREAWHRLRQRAEHDSLTGLANRGVFDAHYRAMVADARDHAGVAALALIDLDHFKAVNDRLGHAAGDECLRQVALRLQRLFGDAVLVARIGGDEFAVLLRGPLGPGRIAAMLARASAALCQPIAWNGARLAIGASIGATILGRRRGRAGSEVFAEADAALYDAKAAGRSAVRIFGAVSAPHETRARRSVG